MEGLKQEREERLQSYRRARSLSPGKHPRSSPQESPSSKVSAAVPGQRKDYRIPDPPRGEGQYPSDIEQLLRDYGRAREEAKTEIARARERLRERTEQEKRRLQQQALSQEAKVSLCVIINVSDFHDGSCNVDCEHYFPGRSVCVRQDDLRHRMRVSNSTLCTGSSLSLSSGPTSGYNSGNTLQLQQGNSLILTGQVGVTHDRTDPPGIV